VGIVHHQQLPDLWFYLSNRQVRYAIEQFARYWKEIQEN
jgi:hypothetical protein